MVVGFVVVELGVLVDTGLGAVVVVVLELGVLRGVELGAVVVVVVLAVVVVVACGESGDTQLAGGVVGPT